MEDLNFTRIDDVLDDVDGVAQEQLKKAEEDLLGLRWELVRLAGQVVAVVVAIDEQLAND